VEEALVEMYLAGVSVRRVEDVTGALWGTQVSPSTASGLNQKIEGHHPYVFLDGLWLKRSWGSEVRNVSLLAAIGVNDEGFREVLAVAEGSKEDRANFAGRSTEGQQENNHHSDGRPSQERQPSWPGWGDRGLGFALT